MNEITKQTVVLGGVEYTLATLTSSKGTFGIASQSLEDEICNIIDCPSSKDYNEACRIDNMYDFVIDDDVMNEDSTQGIVVSLMIRHGDILDKDLIHIK